MKSIVYTEIINKTASQAKIIGCTHVVKALNIEEDRWYYLYYKNEEMGTKEVRRMRTIQNVWDKISGPALIN